MYSFAMLAKNRRIIALVRVYKPKHLTKTIMRIIFCLMVFLSVGKSTMLAQQLSSFLEYGVTLHTGANTPLWQVSNQ